MPTKLNPVASKCVCFVFNFFPIPLHGHNILKGDTENLTVYVLSI